MTEELWIHKSSGQFIPWYKIPGMKVRRLDNLPFNVHPHFPLGEVKVVGEECGKLNHLQDPEREFAHIPVKASKEREIAKDYCFHAYADTLELINDSD